MKHHLAVLVPSYDGKLPTGTVTSLFTLQSNLNRAGHGMSMLFQDNIALVQEARNLLLRTFCDPAYDFTAALCLDADIEFSMQDFAWLMKGAETYDVVAGMYRAKTDEQVMYFVQPLAALDPEAPVPDFIPCKRAPAGFMFVKGNVMRALWDGHKDRSYQHKYGEVRAVYECGLKGGEFVGEDYSFCDKVRELGFTIGAATRVRLRHIGQKAYQGSYAEAHPQPPARTGQCSG